MFSRRYVVFFLLILSETLLIQFLFWTNNRRGWISIRQWFWRTFLSKWGPKLLLCTRADSSPGNGRVFALFTGSFNFILCPQFREMQLLALCLVGTSFLRPEPHFSSHRQGWSICLGIRFVWTVRTWHQRKSPKPALDHVGQECKTSGCRKIPLSMLNKFWSTIQLGLWRKRPVG